MANPAAARMLMLSADGLAALGSALRCLSVVLIPPPQLQSNCSPVMPPRCHKEFIPTKNMETIESTSGQHGHMHPRKKKELKSIRSPQRVSYPAQLLLWPYAKVLIFSPSRIDMLLFPLMQSNCHTYLRGQTHGCASCRRRGKGHTLKSAEAPRILSSYLQGQLIKHTRSCGGCSRRWAAQCSGSMQFLPSALWLPTRCSNHCISFPLPVRLLDISKTPLSSFPETTDMRSLYCKAHNWAVPPSSLFHWWLSVSVP